MPITIPKEVTKGEELVVIPRKLYEDFLHWQKSVKTFTPAQTQKRALYRSRKDFARGDYLTLKEFKHELARRSSP